MKKGVILVCLALFLLAPALAFTVQKQDLGSVVIAELENPAAYNLTITSANAGTAEFYSLVGVDFSPRGAFALPAGTSTVEVNAYPSSDYRDHPGNYVIEYFLKGSDPLFKDSLAFRVVSLKDTLSIIPANLRQEDSMLNVSIENVENTHLEDVELTFNSEFFTTSKKFSLGPYENISIGLPIDKTKSARLTAGRYIMTASINYKGATAKVEGVINYLERQGTSITKESEGFLVRKTTITKKNEGNTIVQDTINADKDIISRLFTIYSTTPSNTERSGLTTSYTWTKQLAPSESWQVSITTNYTWPFLFIVLIVVIVFLVKIYSFTHVTLTKRCSYVKTKGGQFALKVSIHVKARGHVERLQVIDRLPGMTKLYEHFGIKPDKIEHETRRIFWNVERLQSGEERVFSYIIYTTVNVVGRFELPSATAIYEKEGKTHEVLSNHAFFMSETNVKMD